MQLNYIRKFYIIQNTFLEMKLKNIHISYEHMLIIIELLNEKLEI